MSDTETEWYPSDDDEITIVNVVPETEPVITTCRYYHGRTIIPDKDDPCLNRGVWNRFKRAEKDAILRQNAIIEHWSLHSATRPNIIND